MIQATLKGENYIGRLETPESREELLLNEIVSMGAPVSVHELSRTSKMSISRVEQTLKRLRKAGMIEVEPDSAAARLAVKTASVISRGVANLARNTRSMDGAAVQRMVVGDTNLLFGTPQRKQGTPKEGGNDHGRVRTNRPRYRTRPNLRT